MHKIRLATLYFLLFTFGFSFIYLSNTPVASQIKQHDEWYGESSCDDGQGFGGEGIGDKVGVDLRNAALDGNYKKVKAILSKKTSTAEIKRLLQDQPSILMLAAEAGMSCYSVAEARRKKRSDYIRIVRLLVQKGANVNSTNNQLDESEITPLMVAAESHCAEIVEIILKAGALVNRKDSSGITALMRLSRWDSGTLIQKLIKNGAQVEVRNKRGYTALMAASLNSVGAVRPLLAAGANVNARTQNGATAMMMCPYAGPAISERNVDDNASNLQRRGKLIDLLISKGALVNAQTTEGTTALHRSIRLGDSGIVEKLLRKGANPDLKSKEEGTSFEFAKYLRSKIKYRGDWYLSPGELDKIITLLTKAKSKQ